MGYGFGKRGVEPINDSVLREFDRLTGQKDDRPTLRKIIFGWFGK